MAAFEDAIKELPCTLAQAAIAWCAVNNDVSTVILGATSLKQLEENLKALVYLDQFDSSLYKRVNSIFN